MAKKIIKQTIKGRSVGYMKIDISDADATDLIAILEGEVSVFDEKSSGGSQSAYPTALNMKKFSCGDRDTGISCSFKVQHAKATAYTPDFETVVIGAFDASFDSSVKSDYMNLLYDKN